MFDQIIQEIERQGFSTRPHLLSLQDLSEANEFFLSHAGEFKEALVGSKSDRKRVESIRGDLTLWLDPSDAPAEFLKVFKFLDDLKTEINKKLFLGLKDYETHLASYPPGSFYSRHKDCHEKESTRVLSFVFYLNQNWEPQDGGELILYDKNNSEILKVRPTAGTFICFLSEEFPHEVKASRKERRSLTGWIHSKELN
jgi:SM-20-related protein